MHNFSVNSSKGPYFVSFTDNLFSDPNIVLGNPGEFYLIDSNVFNIYKKDLKKYLNDQNHKIIVANENSKSFLSLYPVYEKLIDSRVQGDSNLVAIGGGIVQDIACFIASTYMRGIKWTYLPTTLLAQADSCIGSKSSINLGDAKNILGTFNPPYKVLLSKNFLRSLNKQEILSGLGEILKVHAISSQKDFALLAKDYEDILNNDNLLFTYIYQSLMIKKSYIEKDEFDMRERKVFNYGHSFGHAIESATNFVIPHGIAVSMGMDMANFIAFKMRFASSKIYHSMHSCLQKNYRDFKGEKIKVDLLINALKKDKKNRGSQLGLVLPQGEVGNMKLVYVTPNESFIDECTNFLSTQLNE